LLYISFKGSLVFPLISYAPTLHDHIVRSLSEDDARRIGAELKRWSQRPISATNARVLGLCVILIVTMLVATKGAPNGASAISSLATVFAVCQCTLYYMSISLLRGLLRVGVREARDAIIAVRDPRRISNFDMAMLWVLIALTAHHFE
jgi:hypothetical protein